MVEEAEKVDVDEDFVVMLSDWSLDEKGQIKNDFADPALARGRGPAGEPGLRQRRRCAAPLKARPGARVRLRLGNAATARLTNVGIDGAKTLIVAVDGQPSEPFAPLRNQFPMGPGARFELLFDMPREVGAEVRFALRGDSGAPDIRSSTIKAEGDPVAARAAPARLPPNPALPAEIALEAGAQLRHRRHGRRRGAFRGQRCDLHGLGGEAAGQGRPRRADRVRLRQPDGGRAGACGSAAMSRGSCIRWTTAGSPTGATPS